MSIHRELVQFHWNRMISRICTQLLKSWRFVHFIWTRSELGLQTSSSCLTTTCSTSQCAPTIHLTTPTVLLSSTRLITCQNVPKMQRVFSSTPMHFYSWFSRLKIFKMPSSIASKNFRPPSTILKASDPSPVGSWIIYRTMISTQMSMTKSESRTVFLTSTS